MAEVAIVTGASRGIGAAVAKLLGVNGYRVCVNYRSGQDAAEGVVADIVGRAVRPWRCKPMSRIAMQCGAFSRPSTSDSAAWRHWSTTPEFTVPVAG